MSAAIDNPLSAAFADSVSRLGASTSDFPHLETSLALSEEAVKRARDYLSSQPLSDCIDVIALGSLGRFEMSAASDLDSLIVCRDSADHDHESDARIVDNLRSRVVEGSVLREPGPTGLFGGDIRQPDLYEVIGLEADTNPVHSRRVLVLEESVSLRQPGEHEELLRKMVVRYVDAIPLGRSSVPRFLVNDLARYWHQLAVDYQAKSEKGAPTALRRLKLVIPRKFTYASSVLPLLTCEIRKLGKDEIVERLVEVFKLPPVLRFLNELDYLGVSRSNQEAVSSGLGIMTAVDQFNGLLSNPEWRGSLEGASTREEAEALPAFQHARDLARTLQGSLDALFFSPEMQELTRKYLVF